MKKRVIRNTTALVLATLIITSSALTNYYFNQLQKESLPTKKDRNVEAGLLTGQPTHPITAPNIGWETYTWKHARRFIRDTRLEKYFAPQTLEANKRFMECLQLGILWLGHANVGPLPSLENVCTCFQRIAQELLISQPNTWEGMARGTPGYVASQQLAAVLITGYFNFCPNIIKWRNYKRIERFLPDIYPLLAYQSITQTLSAVTLARIILPNGPDVVTPIPTLGPTQWTPAYATAADAKFSFYLMTLIGGTTALSFGTAYILIPVVLRCGTIVLTLSTAFLTPLSAGVRAALTALAERAIVTQGATTVALVMIAARTQAQQTGSPIIQPEDVRAVLMNQLGYATDQNGEIIPTSGPDPALEATFIARHGQGVTEICTPGYTGPAPVFWPENPGLDPSLTAPGTVPGSGTTATGLLFTNPTTGRRHCEYSWIQASTTDGPTTQLGTGFSTVQVNTPVTFISPGKGLSSTGLNPNFHYTAYADHPQTGAPTALPTLSLFADEIGLGYFNVGQAGQGHRLALDRDKICQTFQTPTVALHLIIQENNCDNALTVDVTLHCPTGTTSITLPSQFGQNPSFGGSISFGPLGLVYPPSTSPYPANLCPTDSHGCTTNEQCGTFPWLCKTQECNCYLGSYTGTPPNPTSLVCPAGSDRCITDADCTTTGQGTYCTSWNGMNHRAPGQTPLAACMCLDLYPSTYPPTGEPCGTLAYGVCNPDDADCNLDEYCHPDTCQCTSASSTAPPPTSLVGTKTPPSITPQPPPPRGSCTTTQTTTGTGTMVNVCSGTCPNPGDICGGSGGSACSCGAPCSVVNGACNLGRCPDPQQQCDPASCACATPQSRVPEPPPPPPKPGGTTGGFAYTGYQTKTTARAAPPSQATFTITITQTKNGNQIEEAVTTSERRILDLTIPEHTTTTVYALDGRELQETQQHLQGNLTAAYTYDSQLRVLSIAYSDGSSDQYAYTGDSIIPSQVQRHLYTPESSSPTGQTTPATFFDVTSTIIATDVAQPYSSTLKLKLVQEYSTGTGTFPVLNFPFYLIMLPFTMSNPFQNFQTTRTWKYTLDNKDNKILKLEYQNPDTTTAWTITYGYDSNTNNLVQETITRTTINAQTTILRVYNYQNGRLSMISEYQPNQSNPFNVYLISIIGYGLYEQIWGIYQRQPFSFYGGWWGYSELFAITL